MIVVLTLYRDWKHILCIGLASVLVNIIYMVYYLKNISSQAADITEFEIVLALLLLLVSFAVATTRTLIAINGHTVEVLKEQKKAEQAIYCKRQVLSGKKWKLFSSSFWQIKSSTFWYSTRGAFRGIFLLKW